MLENTSLRDSLYNMEREIVALLNQGTPQKFVDSDKENVSPMEDVSNIVLVILFHVVNR